MTSAGIAGWLGFFPSREQWNRVAHRVRPLSGWLGPRRRASWHDIRELAAAAEPLRSFAKLSDQEFAQLARGLDGLNQRLASLDSSVAYLQGLFDKDIEENPTHQSIALGKRAIELVHSTVGVAYALHNRINEVEAALRKSLHVQELFNANRVVLRTLAVSLRIEVARCDEESRRVFLPVADEFTSLDRRAGATIEKGFADLNALATVMRQDRESFRSREQAVFEAASERLERLRMDLRGIEQAIEPCSQRTREVELLISSIPAQVASVIGALQYQDIVRQKLEHVEEGLHDLLDLRRPPQALLERMARVQLAQLISARDEISQAGQAVLQGVRGLSSAGAQAATSIAELKTLALRDLGVGRFSETFADDLKHLAVVSRATEETHERIASQVNEIERVIAYFSKEIATQQNEVRLVALNAQVAAARMENAGALEKLAEEASHIAAKNNQATDHLREGLAQTLEKLTSIRAEAERSLEVLREEKSVLEDGAADIGASLRGQATAIENNTSEVAKAFEAAQVGISLILDRITFPEVLQASFLPLTAQLEKLVPSESASLSPPDQSRLCKDSHALLSKHETRYTMEEERSTHRQATRAPAETVTCESNDDDIELF